LKSGERLIVAELGRPHGIRGEIMARVSGIDGRELVELGPVAMRRSDGSERAVRVEAARPKKDGWILRLDVSRGRDEAEALRGAVLLAAREDLPEPDEGEWFVADLIGLAVETESGDALGEIAEVLTLPANDVLVVRGPRGEVLLPLIDDVVKDVDLVASRMRVHLLPGLIEEEEPRRSE
jgi:16S rRNA processing protein RimM